MKVEYIGGAFKPGEFIESGLPEVCFMGRSNVGKSSLINTLARQKQLARVSRTPGRTQALHFFKVTDSYVLVDFPGYGYAKAPKAVRSQFLPLIRSYIDARETLNAGFLLVDVRREPRQDEWDIVKEFQQRSVPLLLVVTKIDKVAKTRRGGRVQQLAKAVGVHQNMAVGFSSLSGDGRTELLARIGTFTGG